MAVATKAKRRSPRGNWIVVRYSKGRIDWCRWCRTWAGVGMARRNAEKYLKNWRTGEHDPTLGRVIVMDIERMADFAVTEAANEIHDLYKLFEK